MEPTRRIRRCWLLAAAILVAAAPAGAVKRRAFATSLTGPGDLSSWPDAGGQTGLAAGDAICRARAAAAALPNANTYRAWLSTATTDAYCHVQGLSGQKATGCNGAPLPGGGPWYLANGITNFTGTLDELTGAEGIIYRPVTVDENFDEIVDGLGVATGTHDDGAASSFDCAGWTTASSGASGSFGYSFASATRWTHWTAATCAAGRHLLCFEPGASETAILGWSPGAVTFVTSVTGAGDLSAWPEAGGATGIAAGDAICQSVAAAAHLPAPGSFVAWLSTASVDAGDRLTLTGVPYRRVDAYTVANSKADLLDGTIPNSIHVTEAGDYIRNTTSVWTGTADDGTALLSDCEGWTTAVNSESARAGNAAIARRGDWTDGSNSLCSTATNRLYCFSNVITLFWDGFDSTGDTSRWSSTVP